MNKDAFTIATLLVASAAVLYLFVWPRLKPVPELEPEPTIEPTPTPDLDLEPEPIVIQGTGIRYQPYEKPIELGGGIREWGVTQDGEPIISKNDPRTYPAWQWNL